MIKDKNTEMYKLSINVSKRKINKEKRLSEMEKLFCLVKKDILSLLKTQQGIRILETCFRFGTEKQRRKLLKKIKPEIILLSQDLIGKYLVLQIIRMSPKGQKIVYKQIKKEIYNLTKTKAGNVVVSELYYKKNKTKRTEFISKFFKEQKLEKITERLLKKLLLKSELSLKIVSEYVCKASPSAVGFLIEELVPYLTENLFKIISCDEGVSFLCNLVWFSSSISKKQDKIISIISSDPVRLSCDYKGFFVSLFVLLQTVEKKTEMLKILKKDLSFLLNDPNGQKIIKYIVSGKIMLTIEQETLFKKVNEKRLFLLDNFREELSSLLNKKIVEGFDSETAKIVAFIFVGLECTVEFVSEQVTVARLEEDSFRYFLSLVLRKKRNDVADLLLSMIKLHQEIVFQGKGVYLLATLLNEFPQTKDTIKELMKNTKHKGEGLCFIQKKLENY